MILIRILPVFLLASAVAAGPDVYTVRADEGLDALEVELCAGDTPPARLHGARGAGRYLEGPRRTRGSVRIRHDGGDTLHLDGMRPGDCLRWSVRVKEAARERSARHGRETDEPVVPSGVWLWRPERSARQPLVRFDLPEGVGVSVPWTPLADGRRGRDFVVNETPPGWPDLTALGRFDAQELPVPGGRLRLAILSGRPAPDRAALTEWIEANARAVAAVYGRFPVPDAQLLVLPIGRGGEAVPWAQVQRGGGPSAHFYIDQFRPLTEFRDDWTATHELSHMLLPYVARRDAWLSEGFASYYQNVLRARAGMITPEQAWQKVYDGFERGRRGTRGDTLAEVSRDMHRRGAFMRVYWSGAAVALLADVELREQSGGSKTLDLALQRLADCCLPSHRTWTAREVLTRLDTLMETDVFVGLYERHKNARQFPDVAPASTALGILERDGRLRFESGPEETALRRAIMTTPAAVLADGTDTDTSHAPQPESTTRTGDSGSPRRTAP